MIPVAALLISVASMQAQFVIRWSGFGAGGGSGSGADIVIDAGFEEWGAPVSSGGGYTLRGGFWSGVDTGAAEPEVPPILRIIPGGTSVTLAWPVAATGYRLQQAMAISSSAWTDVTTAPGTVGTELQVRQPIVPDSRFYRLHKP